MERLGGVRSPRGFVLRADAAECARVRLYPGGAHRLNPLDAGTGERDAHSVPDCRGALLGALIAASCVALFRQSVDDVALTAQVLDLTAEEALATTWLCQGRALWKVGTRTDVVEHVVAAAEAPLCPRHVMQL